MIFPDASPERPVYLACACGGRLELTAPPEKWPLSCPGCGGDVRTVDIDTVADMLPAARRATEAPRLLEGPAGGAAPARRSGGAPARVDDGGLPADFASQDGSVELQLRSFTGRPKVEEVRIRPVETFGAETLALALWIAALLLVAISFAVSTEGDPSTRDMLLASALVAAVTSVFAWFQRATVGPTLRLYPGSGFWVMIGTLGIPLTVGGTLLYYAALEALFDGDFFSGGTEGIAPEGASLPLVLIAVGVLPGIFEEIGFRGWMQSTWRLILPARRAIVLTACFFALIHFSYFAIGWILPMGLYLGWLRERSGNIWPGVIAHMGHNMTIVILGRI